MEKKGFKVGEVFQCGLVKLRVDPASKNAPCDGCFFNSKKFPRCLDLIEILIGRCTKVHREDNTDVIFTEIIDTTYEYSQDNMRKNGE